MEEFRAAIKDPFRPLVYMLTSLENETLDGVFFKPEGVILLSVGAK